MSATSFEGAQALDEIAKRWALHDGTIHSIAVRRLEWEVTAELQCTPRPESRVAALRLHFTGVTRFEILWSWDYDFYFVPSYKALIRESGAVYLSLDPYDERAGGIDARDGGVIEARHLRTELTMKP